MRGLVEILYSHLRPSSGHHRNPLIVAALSYVAYIMPGVFLGD